MAAFFLVHGLNGTGPPGAMLLRQAVDESNGRTWCRSQITRETIDHHNRIATCVINGSVPLPLRGLAMRRHFSYAAMSARDSGIIEEADGPQISSAPFAVCWKDFALEDRPDGFRLRTTLTDNSVADLTLTPETVWLDERSDQLHPEFGSAFAYQCCPRLRAEGTADGHPVEGQFWIDRQWGKYEGWLLASEHAGYRVLGWDWCGLNLDDGRDMLIFRHRDAATARAGAAFGVTFGDGQTELVPTVHAAPSRYWTSPRTAARYPVAWELELPELGLRGSVEPLIEDQEIPVYGTEAVWEGAVQFHGSNGRADVSGLGRLELVGYGVPLTLGAHVRRNFARFAASMGKTFGTTTRD